MKEVMELLLKDVDEDIREVMLRECAIEADPYGGITVSSGIMPTRPVKNWEALPDPFFLIINWQRMRHENRHSKIGDNPHRGTI